MADNNGSKYKEKISITVPVEMLEILDDYCNYYGMCRSSAIAFLVAQSLYVDYSRTNGFDFNNDFMVDTDKYGERYYIKRKDCGDIVTTKWEYLIGKNKQGKLCVVSSDDFSDEDI